MGIGWRWTEQVALAACLAFAGCTYSGTLIELPLRGDGGGGDRSSTGDGSSAGDPATVGDAGGDPLLGDGGDNYGDGGDGAGDAGCFEAPTAICARYPLCGHIRALDICGSMRDVFCNTSPIDYVDSRWNIYAAISNVTQSVNAPRDVRGLAVSAGGDIVYRGFNNPPVVQRIDVTTGTVTSLPGNRGKAIDLDAAGNVYLADGDITIYTGDLMTLLYTIPAETTGSYEGIAVTRENDMTIVYASDRNLGEIRRLIVDPLIGTHMVTGFSGGSGVVSVSGAMDLRGVGLDPLSNEIWVADHTDDRVFRISRDGLTQNSFTVEDPMDVAFDFTNGYGLISRWDGSGEPSIDQVDLVTLNRTNLALPFTALELSNAPQSVGGLSGIAVVVGEAVLVNYEGGAGTTANSGFREPLLSLGPRACPRVAGDGRFTQEDFLTFPLTRTSTSSNGKIRVRNVSLERFSAVHGTLPGGSTPFGPTEVQAYWGVGFQGSTERTYIHTAPANRVVTTQFPIVSTPLASIIDFHAQTVGPVWSSTPPEGSTFNFGSVGMAVTIMQDLTIENVSADPDDGDSSLVALTILSVSVGGGGSPDFSTDFSGPVSLEPGELHVISISFNPTAMGDRAASFSVQTDIGNAQGLPGAIFDFDFAAIGL